MVFVPQTCDFFFSFFRVFRGRWSQPVQMTPYICGISVRGGPLSCIHSNLTERGKHKFHWIKHTHICTHRYTLVHLMLRHSPVTDYYRSVYNISFRQLGMSFKQDLNTVVSLILDSVSNNHQHLDTERLSSGVQ